ncbi:hypothetical protein HDU76_013432 [Blyttiomyces sp. JEL0837]|nr:hypothetical protein HDU76_013432 [Blyttiomyces sp. JEL0837]
MSTNITSSTSGPSISSMDPKLIKQTSLDDVARAAEPEVPKTLLTKSKNVGGGGGVGMRKISGVEMEKGKSLKQNANALKKSGKAKNTSSPTITRPPLIKSRSTSLSEISNTTNTNANNNKTTTNTKTNTNTKKEKSKDTKFSDTVYIPDDLFTSKSFHEILDGILTEASRAAIQEAERIAEGAWLAHESDDGLEGESDDDEQDGEDGGGGGMKGDLKAKGEVIKGGEWLKGNGSGNEDGGNVDQIKETTLTLINSTVLSDQQNIVKSTSTSTSTSTKPKPKPTYRKLARREAKKAESETLKLLDSPQTQAQASQIQSKLSTVREYLRTRLRTEEDIIREVEASEAAKLNQEREMEMTKARRDFEDAENRRVEREMRLAKGRTARQHAVLRGGTGLIPVGFLTGRQDFRPLPEDAGSNYHSGDLVKHGGHSQVSKGVDDREHDAERGVGGDRDRRVVRFVEDGGHVGHDFDPPNGEIDGDFEEADNGFDHHRTTPKSNKGQTPPKDPLEVADHEVETHINSFRSKPPSARSFNLSTSRPVSSRRGAKVVITPRVRSAKGSASINPRVPTDVAELWMERSAQRKASAKLNGVSISDGNGGSKSPKQRDRSGNIRIREGRKLQVNNGSGFVQFGATHDVLESADMLPQYHRQSSPDPKDAPLYNPNSNFDGPDLKVEVIRSISPTSKPTTPTTALANRRMQAMQEIEKKRSLPIENLYSMGFGAARLLDPRQRRLVTEQFPLQRNPISTVTAATQAVAATAAAAESDVFPPSTGTRQISLTRETRWGAKKTKPTLQIDKPTKPNPEIVLPERNKVGTFASVLGIVDSIISDQHVEPVSVTKSVLAASGISPSGKRPKPVEFKGKKGSGDGGRKKNVGVMGDSLQKRVAAGLGLGELELDNSRKHISFEWLRGMMEEGDNADA